MELKGKVALVTGSGQGIGRAIALAFAKEGADIVVNVRKNIKNAEAVANAVRNLGQRSLVYQVDVSNYDQVKKMVNATVDAFGRIDILVNNAGASGAKPLEELSEEEWKTVVDVNLNGVFYCTSEVGKLMIKQKGGNIINIAGASAHRCYPNGGAFGPTKAAVISLTKQLAVEWAKHGIRINAISPGPIMTSDTIIKLEDEKMRAKIAKIPMARVGTPEEIANVAVFLASDKSSYITGQSIIVDGGGAETWYLYP